MPTISEQLFSLPIIKQLTPYISLRQKGEIPVIVINHSKVRAVISQQGAQLLAWQPCGQQPVIWLSSHSEFISAKAIRGGVPICWPWFGKVSDPAHGFARNLLWDLTAYDQDKNGVWLTFTLHDSPESQKIWPHEFCLIARFNLAQTCDIELEAHGEFTTTAALHSYFSIGDINQTSVTGLGKRYIDQLTNLDTVDEQQSVLTFSGQVDRIYPLAEFCSHIDDHLNQRTIEVHHHHYSDVVAWNPGAQLSFSMADMVNEGYKTMVCIETARINNPLVSTATKAAQLAVTFRCRNQHSNLTFEKNDKQLILR